MKLFNMATPVVMLAGLLFASVGITDGVLTADSLQPSGQLLWAQPAASSTLSVAAAQQVLEEAGSEAVAEVSGSTSAAQPGVVVLNDPYVDMQWALKQVWITQPSTPATAGAGVLVAVLDTGVSRNHEDLEGRVVLTVNLTSSPVADDVCGHGTHIAGVIAANSNNGVGIAGIAPACQIMSIKVADDRGITSTATMVEGIIRAVEEGASVINISAEFFEPSAELEAAIDYAWEKGALVVAAAGNRGNQMPVYPAYYENCIAVAASMPDGTLAPLSSYGDWVDVVAPGFDIYSTLPGNSYGYKSGTSFAAAHVSGLAALLFETVTDTSGNGRVNDEVRAAIESGF
jgi:thermitase